MPSASMRPSTYSWRRLARGKLTTGLMDEGALGSPASIAASASDNDASGLPKYACAALPKP
ncbi:hypothetical protein D3C72_1565660 [compost metagenome]